MDHNVEMHYYLIQLKNAFIHKNRADLLSSFHDFAIMHKPLVMSTLSRVNPDESEIFWNFIESVCDHANEWQDFICSEFNRLLIYAETMDDPSQVINSLEAFHILKESVDDNFVKKIKTIIKSFLNTGNISLRRFVVWFFANCIHDFDDKEIVMIQNLRFDDDVIVRYYAFTAYNTLQGLPPDNGLPAVDKLVIDISDVYFCESFL